MYQLQSDIQYTTKGTVMRTILIILLKILFSFSYVSDSYALTSDIPPDIKKIMNRGKLIVALQTGNYPPYFYEDENKQLAGLDIDIARDIAKNLSVELEFNRTSLSFTDVVKLVEKDAADLAISAISSTLSRGLSVHFSEAYLIPNQAIILNRLLEIKIKNNAKIDKELLKVAVLNNSSYEEYFTYNKSNFDEFNKEIRAVSYSSLDSAITDVISGKIFAVYCDETFANYVIKNRKSVNIYVRSKIFENEFDPISIAVNWRNSNLLNWINLYIKRKQYDGKLKNLIKTHMKDSK